MWCKVGKQTREDFQIRWSTPNIQADPQHLRHTCHQVLSLSPGGSGVGGEGGTEERCRKRGNWWKVGLFHSSLEMLSRACSVCWFPHGFQMLSRSALTESDYESFHRAAQQSTATGPLGVWSVICQRYSTPALWLRSWDVWVGGRGIAPCLLPVVGVAWLRRACV